MIKDELVRRIERAVRACQQGGALPAPTDDEVTLPAISVTPSRDPARGDYSCDIALLLARDWRRPPRDVAQAIVRCLSEETGDDGILHAAEVADAGFINFRLAPGALGSVLRRIVETGDAFGRPSAEPEQRRRVLVEFVSAHPSGPITVQHGRGAVIGDTLVALLVACGNDVQREFYVNDAASAHQTRLLARSVLARCRQTLGLADASRGDDGLAGEYVDDLASAVLAQSETERLVRRADTEQAVAALAPFVSGHVRQTQQADLESFGVRFDTWQTESSLLENGAVEQTLVALKAAGHAYEKNGALWLRSSAFGDEQDRVLVRSGADGSAPTYIAGDLAYHANKFARGFDALVNVFGADHGGYVARTRAGLRALGLDESRLRIVVYQPVRLLQDGQERRGGRHGGAWVTLSELVAEVGRDAGRFFLLLAPPDAPLDLDLNLARTRGMDNPLYRIQAVCARCQAALSDAEAAPPNTSTSLDGADVARLLDADEIALVKRLADFPDEVRAAADNAAPHLLPRYLLNVADQFLRHGDRTATAASASDPALFAARQLLLRGTQIVLRSGLDLLGVSAVAASE